VAGLLDYLYNPTTYGGEGGLLSRLIPSTAMIPQSQGFPQQDQAASFNERWNALPQGSGRSFDAATFDPSTYAPSQPSNPIAVGNYQMPRLGNPDQFLPQQAMTPPNATPTQGQVPQMLGAQGQEQSLPPALGGRPDGFFDRLNTGLQSIGNGGSLIGALTGNRTDAQSVAQQNLTAQYRALVPLVGHQKAMLAVLNPEAGKTILAQALEKKNYGFTKLDGDTVLRQDPQTGKVEVAYGGGDANSQGVAGPDGKIIPYPAGLDAAGRKTFANEIARINADAAGGKKTEVQAKSEKFANLMEIAEKNLKGIEGEGLSLTGKALSNIPGGLGNYGQSANFQKFTQAKNKFITSLLRDESGAAIGTPEFARYERELFPQPGDGPEVVAQKAENRRAAIEAMKKSAGPGYKSPDVTGSAPQAPTTGSFQEGATATNPQTGQKLTFRNGKWQ
jgi:hypothetical protein